MFNLYIHDYFTKRGFKRAARELQLEAELGHHNHPPIDARQGLLFEWWSVFWLIFSAKTGAGGTDDAALYTQHVQAKPSKGANRAAQPQSQTQRPVQHPPSGNMNGIGSTIPSQHQLPPGASQMNFSMGGGPAPQLNGVSSPHPPTPGSAHHPHGPQPPNFNPMAQGIPRPPSMNGPPQPHPSNGQPSQQQRPVGTPNHNLPFQSPTMAHSPLQPGPSGQQTPGVGPQSAPMGNLSGPSPHMVNRGAMMPPNGVPPGMGMGGMPQQPQQPGQSAPQGPNFGTSVGRPPSRTNTPQGQPGMMHSSPLMGNRQPIPPPNPTNEYIEAEFRKLPTNTIHNAKLESGIPAEKDNAALTIAEKRRIFEHVRRKAGPPTGPGTPLMQAPNMQQQPRQMQPQNRAIKRNSTSPGEELDMQSADTSPPDRKRARRSPAEIPKGATPMPYPPTPQMGTGPLQGPSGPLPQPPPSAGMQSHMMRANIGPPGGPGHQQMAMNGIMPPSMPGQPGPPQAMGGMHSPMGPPMGLNNMGQMGGNYQRVPLHQVHNTSGGPGQGGPGPNRMVPPPPGAMGAPGGMPPPPSPANSATAPNKDGQKDGKAIMDMASPRGGPQQQTPQQGGMQQQAPQQQQQQQGGQTPQGLGAQQLSQPGTPGPQGPQGQQPGTGNGPQSGGGPGSSGGSGMIPTSGNLMAGSGMSMMNTGDLFLDPPDFALGPFDNTNFNMDGTLDFERDFGSWFNGEDSMGGPMGGALEMK